MCLAVVFGDSRFGSVRTISFLFFTPGLLSPCASFPTTIPKSFVCDRWMFLAAGARSEVPLNACTHQVRDPNLEMKNDGLCLYSLTRGVAVVVHRQRVCTHRQKFLHCVRVTEIRGQRQRCVPRTRSGLEGCLWVKFHRHSADILGAVTAVADKKVWVDCASTRYVRVRVAADENKHSAGVRVQRKHNN